jgi:hypothetical protein
LPEQAASSPAGSNPPGSLAFTSSVHTMLRGRNGLSPVMIGRHTSLDRLLGLVEAAEVRSGDGPEIALVSGEAVIGKTRLLREFIAALPADVTVLTAQARPGSMGRPFDVVGQLGPTGDNSAATARAILEAAVAAGRTLLVVEDLHWADADSVHFIEQVCMQAWPQLVIVGTYRGNDLSRKAPGGELVLRLERQHNVEQITPTGSTGRRSPVCSLPSATRPHPRARSRPSTGAAAAFRSWSRSWCGAAAPTPASTT